LMKPIDSGSNEAFLREENLQEKKARWRKQKLWKSWYPQYFFFL